MSYSSTHFFARIHKHHKTIEILWRNKMQYIVQKTQLEMYENSEILILYNTRVLNENNGRKSNVAWKNKGKCKVTNPNCVKMNVRKPKQANWKNSKILAFVKQMEV